MKLTQNLDIALTAGSRSSRKIPTKRDTSDLCRERASADLLASAAMINANQRLRLETSAASWIARADTLQWVEESFARRTAEAAERAVARAKLMAEPPKL